MRFEAGFRAAAVRYASVRPDSGGTDGAEKPTDGPVGAVTLTVRPASWPVSRGFMMSARSPSGLQGRAMPLVAVLRSGAEPYGGGCLVLTGRALAAEFWPGTLQPAPGNAARPLLPES